MKGVLVYKMKQKEITYEEFKKLLGLIDTSMTSILWELYNEVKKNKQYII